MSARRSASAVHARILLVNDNAHGLSARKKVLEELGHRIVTADGRTEALDQFARQKFDLVVTDHKKPGLDGLELIAHLRKLTAALPIILVSGRVDSMGLNETNTGADVVIQKSATEVSHLIRAVSRLLGRKPARKPAASEKRPSRTRHEPQRKTV